MALAKSAAWVSKSSRTGMSYGDCVVVMATTYRLCGPWLRSILMAETWAISGVDLHLDLKGPRVRAALETALRDAVSTGRLAPGGRLPSSRALAADLGIARNTVAEAYGQLVAEGWLTAVQGSGTRVAQRPEVPETTAPARSGSGRRIRYDLSP